MRSVPDLSALRTSPSIVAASLGANMLGLALPLVMIQLYDRVIPNGAYETLIVLSFGLALAIIGDLVLKLARGILLANAGARYEFSSGQTALRNLLKNPEIEKGLQPGELLIRLSRFDRIQNFHTGDAGAALLDIPFIILFLCVLIYISPMIGATILVMMSIVFLCIRQMRRRVITLTEERIERDGRRQSFLIETLSGIEVVRSFGAEDFMERRYERLLAGNAPISADLAAQVQLTQGLAGAVGLLAPTVTAGVGAFLVLDGQMTVGAMAATILLSSRIIQPALRLEALLIGEEDIRHMEEEVKDLLVPPRTPGSGAALSRVLTMEARLPGPNGSANGQSLRLTPGDCLVITGENSRKKRALLDHLTGEYAVDGFNLLINDRPAADYDVTAFAERVSLLRRQHEPIRGTLLENMCRFQVERFRDRALHLTSELGIDGFIANHPQGLSLSLGGETGRSLPASISDAVKIIQGLVCDPDVILFDEVNVALDQNVDARVLSHLAALREKKILILVTHRPAFQDLANLEYHIDSGTMIRGGRSAPVDLSQFEVGAP